MLRKKLQLAFAVLALGAGIAKADGPVRPVPPVTSIPLYGSDTLFDVTTKLITDCGRAADLAYKGTGSGNGGLAMTTGLASNVPPIEPHNQQLAPQSRFLSAGECGSLTATNNGNGINIGLDGIAIVADGAATSPNTCDTLRHSRTSIGGFTFNDWRDVLRLLYGGQSIKVTFPPCRDPGESPRVPAGTNAAGGCGNGVIDANETCDDGNTTNFDGCASNCTLEIYGKDAAPAIVGRCRSPERLALIANWGEMFEETCANGNCTALRHAWRRDDVSGTTDTFLTLLALPAATGRTFCNGLDNEDLDPARTTCAATEQVCSNLPYANLTSSNKNGGNPSGTTPVSQASGVPGDLGVVQAISIPTDLTKQYRALCTAPVGGAFKYVDMPTAIALEAQKCPDGTARVFSQCLWPYNTATGQICLARIGNRPTIRAYANFDARGYNQIPRDPTSPTGAILLKNPTTGTIVNDPRHGGGAFQIHQTASMPAPSSGTCLETDATRQIGCLVHADVCSIGYAGREAITAANKSIFIRTPDASGTASAAGQPGVDAITFLLDPAGTTAPYTCPTGSNFGKRYPLSRKLWINSVKGMANVTNDVTAKDGMPLTTNELQFLQCAADRTNHHTDDAINASHFIPIPDSYLTYPVRTCAVCGDGIVTPPLETCDPPVPGGATGTCNASCAGLNP